jgi:hypothetical protein
MILVWVNVSEPHLTMRISSALEQAFRRSRAAVGSR